VANGKTKVFISYAHGDDDDFVRTLRVTLNDLGFHVWQDLTSMHSRGPEFEQEIRDAITRVDRLVLVAGPKALKSKYVRMEWEWARHFGKPVTPILRRDGMDYVPDGLKHIHCIDCCPERSDSEVWRELARVLREPPARFAPLYGVPDYPPHYLERQEDLDGLRKAVLLGIDKPVAVTASGMRSGVQGRGGSGKSVLAAALARDADVRYAFPDGVVWVTLGREPKITARQAQVVAALSAEPRSYADAQDGRSHLSKVLSDKACLLILDDVWKVEDGAAFDALGPRCRMLVTTRDAGVVRGLGAEECRIGVPAREDARVLLAKWAGVDVSALPAEADEIVEECGGLPLALAIIGGKVRGEKAEWGAVLHHLKTADLGKIGHELRDYPYRDMLKTIQISVDDLDAGLRERYVSLAVFPEDTAVPVAALATYWGTDEYDARDVIDELADRALVRRDDEGRPALHDLLYDYVRMRAGSLEALHARLIDAYSAKAPDGRHAAAADGYYFEHLVYHMMRAGRGDEARGLLSDYQWLRARLDATDVNGLAGDYEYAADDRDLQLVQGALRLSSHVLLRDKPQLASQVCGRLSEDDGREVMSLIRSTRECEERPWLRSLRPGLTPPGGPLLRMLEGHRGGVSAVAVLEDGRKAISASDDKTLKVWDLSTGAVVRTLEGHSGGVSAVAVFEDGRKAISASDDKTLKVWDLSTGAVVRTLEGHRDWVRAVAVFEDGRKAISASDDKTLKVWDLSAGAVVRTLEGHSGSVNAVAVFEDGGKAVSASDDKTLKVWDLSTGAVVRTLEGHSGSVRAVAVFEDGKKAISASDDKTLLVWDMETGTVITAFTGDSGMTACALCHNGRTIVCGDESGHLHLLRLDGLE
jgi:WD40 repeat protein